MKTKIVYVCAICGQTFDRKKDGEEHEASHFGLTREEYQSWRELDWQAASAGRMASCCSNQKTQKALDDAIDALLTFEHHHNLTGESLPAEY